MKLLIAIPALNEEESIDAIIRRSLEACAFICAHSPVTEVAITVVSDGSTDHTVERASQYTDRIDLIVFPKNKGYGSALPAE
jgi:glycosyltransferase involved in cell wall biosynthesis